MLKGAFTMDLIEAGCDEAGRGCLAGPVVAAAVILPKGYRHALLNDSKKVSLRNREKLRIDIEKDALAWTVANVSNDEIDRINILNASFKAMHLAIDRLKITPELLLIDGNRFTPFDGLDHVCIIKGDGLYLSIAAASILAKTHRDEYMSSLSDRFPGYSWHTNVGYPTPGHRNAIKKLGVTPYHRRSFRLLPYQFNLFY